MLLDELRELVVDRGPDFARHHRLERRRRHHEVDVALADVAGVDDAAVMPEVGAGDRGIAGEPRSSSMLAGESLLPGTPTWHRHPMPDQELRHLLDGLLRRGQADALHGLRGIRRQPLERERQMRAALGLRHGVDFVDDHGAHGRAASRAPRRSSAVDRATRAWSRGCAAACAASRRARSARCRRCAPARGFPARAARAACSSAEIPASGASRLRWMSFDSAFSGDTYTTRVTSCSPPAAPSRTSESMAARNAASVLPEPVGAAISAWLPLAIAGHASSCAGVAPSGKRAGEPRLHGGMKLGERHGWHFI